MSCMIGKTISHYKILERIGGGGMGVVYKAEDTKLKRPIALKFLPPAFATDSTTKERFVHEAQAASALQHNNICAIHEIDETDDGQMYIVMDYYEGKTLKEKLEKGKLDIEDAINYTIQIAQGLQEAHQREIVHRDIKPANIIITEKGEAKILDFGLAKLSGQKKLTREGTTLGTVAYMSPEQVRGEEIDHRSDIWSLGVILYETFTGQLPFKGEYEQALMYSILNDNPQALVNKRLDIPEELEQIIGRCLKKDRNQRFQSTREVMQHLEELRGQRTEFGAKVVDLKALLRSLKKPRIAFPVLLIIFSIIVFIFFLFQHRLELQNAQE